MIGQSGHKLRLVLLASERSGVFRKGAGMVKKLLVLCALLAVLAGGCAWEPLQEPVAREELLIGCVMLGADTEQGWNAAHSAACDALLDELGLSGHQLLMRYGVNDTETAITQLTRLAERGCQLIFVTSYDLEPAMLEVAKSYPKVQFCACSGYLAPGSVLENVHDYFGHIEQARYLAGMAAALSSDSGRLGFVAAFPSPECISGMTAFFLGARAVDPDISMEAHYTYEWSDAEAERQAAQQLIDRGADVLSHHSDDPEPLRLICKLNGAAFIPYNSGIEDSGVVLTAVGWDWSVYMAYAARCVIAGEPIAVDWRGSLADGACTLAPLNTELAGEGAEARLQAARAALQAGEVQVFSGPLYAADGRQLLAAGEVFVEPQSAPSWVDIVDGIIVNWE